MYVVQCILVIKNILYYVHFTLETALLIFKKYKFNDKKIANNNF